uniref:hypothetical protein n=1 Tax=Pseudomonas aeruginosa TaxID=287 RepID=UPI0031FECE16
MDVKETPFEMPDLSSPPPMMPWRDFANWIRMGDRHDVVWGWIRNGYIPSQKYGKHMMVQPDRAEQPTAGERRTNVSKAKWNLDLCGIATFAEMCSVSYGEAAQWAEDGTVPSLQMGCFRMINL